MPDPAELVARNIAGLEPRMSELERIADAVAAMPLRFYDDPNGPYWEICDFCDARQSHLEPAVFPHKPDCVKALAERLRR